MAETVGEPEGERVVGFADTLEWLEELLTSPWTNDKAARLAGIQILQQTLTKLGVDVESLVRYGLADQISGTLIASLILDTSFPGKMNNFLVETGRWRELLQIPFRDATSPLQQLEPAEFNAVVNKARSHILAWIKNAPFAEVASFIPPTEDQLREYMLRTEMNDDRVADDYIWIWQRTRVEEMYRWSDESLFKEFRWLEGDTAVSFPVSILADAGPKSTVVDHEVARRAAYAADEPVNAADPLVWQMQDQALKLLVQEKPEEAAALFAF